MIIPLKSNIKKIVCSGIITPFYIYAPYGNKKFPNFNSLHVTTLLPCFSKVNNLQLLYPYIYITPL